jgi:hypothetical protein
MKIFCKIAGYEKNFLRGETGYFRNKSGWGGSFALKKVELEQTFQLLSRIIDAGGQIFLGQHADNQAIFGHCSELDTVGLHELAGFLNRAVVIQTRNGLLHGFPNESGLRRQAATDFLNHFGFDGDAYITAAFFHEQGLDLLRMKKKDGLGKSAFRPDTKNRRLHELANIAHYRFPPKS